MFIQHILVWVIFVGAVIFLVSMFRKTSKSDGCGGGCSACKSIDFNKIEQQVANSNYAKGPNA